MYYPAVFHKAEPNEIGFWVEFPDLSGCLTEGDTIKESYIMVNEALEKGINFSQILQETLIVKLKSL